MLPRFTRLELNADSKRTNLCVLNQCFESAFRGNEHKRKADLNCSTNYVIQNTDSTPKNGSINAPLEFQWDIDQQKPPSNEKLQ